ncbi:hypothetical protein PC110_g11073 [Phytophthora cactorum]|uniref:Uncharacterized protein n=1 Tax=Phytophthora cactorum TaxID=29920 RepID=A0A329SAL2_9STRA|nr:hypothetical protein PC110_g11073 [Phytophthora cactorum]
MTRQQAKNRAEGKSKRTVTGDASRASVNEPSPAVPAGSLSTDAELLSLDSWSTRRCHDTSDGPTDEWQSEQDELLPGNYGPAGDLQPEHDESSPSPSAFDVDQVAVQEECRHRIAVAQDEEARWRNIKAVLVGETEKYSYHEAKDAWKWADKLVVTGDATFYYTRSNHRRGKDAGWSRLWWPKSSGAKTPTKYRVSCLARGSCGIEYYLSTADQVTNHHQGAPRNPCGLLDPSAPISTVHMIARRHSSVDHTRPDSRLTVSIWMGHGAPDPD